MAITDASPLCGPADAMTVGEISKDAIGRYYVQIATEPVDIPAPIAQAIDAAVSAVSGGSQTPWTGDVGGAGFDLTDVGTVSADEYTFPGSDQFMKDAAGLAVVREANNEGVFRIVGDGNIRARGSISFGIGADLLTTDTDTGFDKDIAGFPKPTGGSAGGTTVGLALPTSAANPVAPATGFHIYVIGSKLVFQYDDSGTTRYFTLDGTQTITAVLAVSTTPP